ncbi:MAG: lamin tail domain-containing protein [Phycisphaerae bacterium]|nr:lamin tail domain-containing protein [Phycisphaerae bacterium]
MSILQRSTNVLLLFVLLSPAFAQCPRADLDGDCAVTFEDLFVLATQWLDIRNYTDLGLVAHWTMDDASGTHVSDATGNNHQGDLMNMDIDDWVSGKFGGGLDFDGIDDYVRITGYMGIAGDAPRTVTAWINTTALSGEIVTWGQVGVPTARWIVRVQEGRVRVEVGDGFAIGTTAVCNGRWRHIAVASDGTTTDNIRIYVDGMPDPISDYASQVIDTAQTDEVKIGVHLVTARYFSGAIDDVRIYDRVLDDAEIAQLGAPQADLDGSALVDAGDLAVLAADWLKRGAPRIVINEIHYDPDIKTELVEFLELYNAGDTVADLSGWYFSSGITLRFADGTAIPPGGYLVITQNAAAFAKKFGFNARAVFEGKLNNSGETVRLRNADRRIVDEVDYSLGFPWPTVGDPVPPNQPGRGHSIQLIHPDMDNDLGGNWRSGVPTPGAQNSVLAANAPPQMRQIKHSPQSPRANEPVTITIKVTDPEGVKAVTLLYQAVNPGQYIKRTDPLYASNWTSLPMYDDGTNGDAAAGDNVYTVVMPAAMQVHRRLMRYRVTAEDNTGLSIRAPYLDDPCPNFAYFVYNGVPAWSGAIQPGSTDPARARVVTYGPEVMRSLPVYHLISPRSEVEAATWGGYMGSDYLWQGTLVYDGDVYDHIRFRARGGTWRYAMGKNMWKFDFNRGHDFQARNDYGEKYGTKWDKLNFSACIQQGDYQHRGEQGMFEAAGFKLFNMMDVPAPKTHWLQFRIIDEAAEQGATQYDGDFWGLYMAIEQMDGRFLDEHDLPDGNLYKIEGHLVDGNEKNNQGLTAVADMSDFYTFRTGYYSYPYPTEDWWHANVNLDCYYGYRCVVEGIHHGDIGYGKNYFFYLNPDTAKWSQLPWDLDLTWANNMYGDGEDPFKKEGAIFSNANLRRAYENRLREFHNLLYNPDQMNQLLDEYAAIVKNPAGGPSIVDADRAMWDYNPVMTTRTHSGKGGVGRFYQQAATKDFPGMVQIMKNYVTGYRGFNTYSEDPAMPRTPQVAFIGAPNYPVNDLRFSTSPYSDPQGAHTFAAMKWRIAEVSPFTTITQPGGPISLVSPQSTWRYFKGLQEPSPAQQQWRQIGFNDNPATTSWRQGAAPVGYDSSLSMGTRLSDMNGNYTAIYLRKEFDIADPAQIKSLKAAVQYDDGFNLWINGYRVAWDNVPAENVAYNAQLSTYGFSARENNNFIEFPLPDPKLYLVSGTNVIAVQVLNVLLSNSSDCFVDVALTAEPADGQDPPPVPPNYYRKPGKYEIDAAWDSGEITAFQDNVRIPVNAVRPGRTYRVRVRMKDNTNRWSHWSAPVQFVAGEPFGPGILQDLRITEIMYNPVEDAAGGAYEFIELKNIGDEPQPLDLSGVSFTAGVTFDFAAGSVRTLGPGEFVLVVENIAAFESRYGTALTARIAGEYSGKLANEGETLRLEDTWNGVIAEFEYSDGRGWPLTADGAGHSLVPLDTALPGQPNGSAKYGGNWRASTYIHGSPGADDPAPPLGVLINEVMAHTDYFDPARPEYDSNDWIELYNASGAPIEMDGDWYLSDRIDNLKKWALPNVNLAAHGHITFDEVTGFHNPVTTGFGLDKAGEQVFLSYLPGDGTDRVVDFVKFKGQENFISLGRYPDGAAFWFPLSPTPGAPNTGPIPGVVISELMYHPPGNEHEYIELQNPAAFAVNLFSTEGPWRLAGGVSYRFPPQVAIPAGKKILIVPFDPATDATALAQFKVDYEVTGLTPGLNIFGPYDGNLSNAGERIALEKAEAPDLPNPDVPWIIVDEVIYGDCDPWPASPDGDGDALQRISTAASASGSDPANWRAAAPSPGY